MANARRRRRRQPSEPDAITQAKRAKLLAAEQRKLRDDGIDVSQAEIEGIEISAERKAELEAKGVTVVLDHRQRLKRAHKADIWEELHSRGRLTQEQHAAVCGLRDLMYVRAGVAGKGDMLLAVNVETTGDACAVTDRMIDAARRIDITLKLIGPPSSALLCALLEPIVAGEGPMMQKQMRRCVAWDYRELKDKSGRVFAAGGRRTCETLNEADAKRCCGCGGDLANAALETVSVPEEWRATVTRITREREPHAQAALLRFAAQALVDVQDAVERRLKFMADAREGRAEEAPARRVERVEPLFA